MHAGHLLEQQGGGQEAGGLDELLEEQHRQCRSGSDAEVWKGVSYMEGQLLRGLVAEEIGHEL